jgi:hypothetical protein
MSDPAPALDDAQKSENAPETKPAVKLGKKDEVEKPDRPTAERRFVAKSVNAFVQWMPLGGSGAAFASFCLQQNWAQAVMMFPVTAVTGVWAAYSKNFVEQLQELYAARGKSDANAFVAWIDSANEALKWQTSGFEAKYLKCQRLDCQEDDPIGVKETDGIFTPLLQEVFVPLRLSLESSPAGYVQRTRSAERSEVPAIWDLLRQARKEPAFRQIAIRAWGGYGKTTLLKHLAYCYGGSGYRKYGAPKFVPFLLYLSRCRSEITKAEPLNLPDLLTQYHLPRLPKGDELKVPPNWALNLLRNGNALVMFDGFDEVPPAERSVVSQWISEQMRRYSDSVFIVTSRPTAYTEDYSAKRPTASFWVDNFDDVQQRRFVEQWYCCQERMARAGRNTADVKLKAQRKAESLLQQIKARPELKAMAGNALMLNMMARFHRDKQEAELPRRKVELYQDICELQLGRRPKQRGLELLLASIGQRQEVLQVLALEMMKQAATNPEGFKQIRRDNLLAVITPEVAQRDADVDANDFLKQVVQVSELLVEREPGLYEFSHLSFQEFLAASEIVRLKQESMLYQQLKVDAWKPTILFYSYLVNPTTVIREAVSQGAIQLADQIWRETPRRTNLSATEETELRALGGSVQSAKYQRLEELLQAKQWREADKETYRLMITTVDKEEGQWFDPEDLRNFPCEDLRALDDLWVRYSPDGKWGFSVQKRIWQECGSPGPYDEKTKAQWEQFGDRVGWRKDGNWLEYENLEQNLVELPVVGMGGLLGGSLWGSLFVWGLFSRVQTCKL